MPAHVTLDPLIALRLWSRFVEFPPRQRVSALQAGGYISSRRGRGIDFDEVRRYQPGDDIRSMDWRVTARTGHPHTKVFRDERERPVYLLIDFQPSMNFGTRRVTKRVLAAEVAALFAWAARRHGDRIGGFIVGPQGNTEVPPTGGDRGVLRLLHDLVEADTAQSGNAAQPGSDNIVQGGSDNIVQGGSDNIVQGGNTNVAQDESMGAVPGFVVALERLCQRVHPGDAVLIISDFYSLTPTAEQRLAALAARSDVSLIHISDPLERHAPPAGTYPVYHGDTPVFWQVAATHDDPVARLFEMRCERLEMLSRTHHMQRMACGTELTLPEQRAVFHSQLSVSIEKSHQAQEGHHD